MESYFYRRVLALLETTSIKYHASSMLENFCKDIGRAPDNLKPSDGGALIVHLMIKLVDFIPETEWLDLDEKFKNLTSEGQEAVHKGKAKGIILHVLLTSIKRKWGTNAEDRIVRNECMPLEFKSDAWYPLDILISMLEELQNIEEVNPNYRRLGTYLITKSGTGSNLFVFRKSSLMLAETFENLAGFFTLEDFEVTEGGYEDGAGVTIRYTGVDNECFKLLFAGICSGIMELRDEPATVIISRNKNGPAQELSIKRESVRQRVPAFA